MSPDVPGRGPVDETMGQRVHAIAQEAYRRRLEQTHPGHDIDAPTVILAIEIALSGWTPPEPAVDPDLLAFREWAAGQWPPAANYLYQRGLADNGREAQAFLAGVRMATDRERERAKELVGYVENQAPYAHRARAILAKYRGEAC